MHSSSRYRARQGGVRPAMRYRMLGPPRVRSGDGWMPVAAEKQRIVLAVLLAHAGQITAPAPTAAHR